MSLLANNAVILAQCFFFLFLLNNIFYINLIATLAQDTGVILPTGTCTTMLQKSNNEMRVMPTHLL